MLQESIIDNSKIFKIKNNALITKNSSDYKSLRFIGRYNITHVINYLMLDNLQTNNDIMMSGCETFNINKIFVPNSYDIENIDSLQMKINDYVILDIPFSYILFFSIIKKNDQNTKITINTNTFISKLIGEIGEIVGIEGINLMKFKQVYLNLKSTKEIHFSMRIKQLFHDYKLRKKLIYGSFINKILDFNIKFIDQTNYKYKITGSELQGIFINFKCAYVKVPTEMQIILNEELILDYDKEELLKIQNVTDWTQKHSLALYDSLQSYLPNEIIYQIEKKIVNNYSYHIKFKKYYMASSTHPTTIHLKFNKKISKYGKIMFIQENEIRYFDNNVIKLYDNQK